MKTKTLNVTCSCMATYSSSIEVPADMSLEDAIEYAKEHIDRINVAELEYVYDFDSINEESCSFDEDEVLDYKDKEIKPIVTVDELIDAIESNVIVCKRHHAQFSGRSKGISSLIFVIVSPTFS